VATAGRRVAGSPPQLLRGLQSLRFMQHHATANGNAPIVHVLPGRESGLPGTLPTRGVRPSTNARPRLWNATPEPKVRALDPRLPGPSQRPARSVPFRPSRYDPFTHGG
jgi:hypothetical protein